MKNYKNSTHLGGGNFGKVFRIQSINTEKFYVVKVI